jgi:hypothetical protein
MLVVHRPHAQESARRWPVIGQADAGSAQAFMTSRLCSGYATALCRLDLKSVHYTPVDQDDLSASFGASVA